MLFTVIPRFSPLLRSPSPSQITPADTVTSTVFHNYSMLARKHPVNRTARSRSKTLACSITHLHTSEHASIDMDLRLASAGLQERIGSTQGCAFCSRSDKASHSNSPTPFSPAERGEARDVEKRSERGDE